MKKRMSSVKSVAKSVRKSDATVLPAIDVVKLNFGELIDLSLGQTEDSANYGAVSFGLLRELLLAIVDRMGVRKKIALAYDSQSPPEVISAGNSPLTRSSTEFVKRNVKSEVLKKSEEKTPHDSHSETGSKPKAQSAEVKNHPEDSLKSVTKSSSLRGRLIVQIEPELEPAESVNQPIESKVTPAESVNQPIESKVKPAESVNQPIETEAKRTTSTDLVVESKEKPTEFTDQPLESKHHSKVIDVAETDVTAIKVKTSKESSLILTGKFPVDKLSRRLDELEQAVAGLSRSATDSIKKPLDIDEPDIESRLTEIENGMGVMMNIFKDMNDKVSNERRLSGKDGENQTNRQTTSVGVVAYEKQPSMVDTHSAVSPAPTALAGLQKQLNKLENKLQTFSNKMTNLDNDMTSQKQDMSQFTQLVSDEMRRLSDRLGLCVQWDELEKSFHGKPMRSITPTMPGAFQEDSHTLLGSAIYQQRLPTHDQQLLHRTHTKSASLADGHVRDLTHSDGKDKHSSREDKTATKDANGPSGSVSQHSRGQHGQSTGQHGQSTRQPGQSTGQAGQSTGQPGQSTGQPGSSTGQPGQSTGQPGQSTGQPGSSTGQPGSSTGQPGSSTGQAGQSTGQAGQSTGQAGQSTGQAGQSTGQAGQSTGQAGQSTGQAGQSTGQAGQFTGQAGQSTGQAGQSTGQAGQSTGQAGQSTGQAGQSTGQAGQSTGQAGQSTGQAGQSTAQNGLDIEQHGSNLRQHDSTTEPRDTSTRQHGFNTRPGSASPGHDSSMRLHGVSSAADNWPPVRQSSSTIQRGKPSRGLLDRQRKKVLEPSIKPMESNKVAAAKSKSDSRYNHLIRQSEIAKLHQQRLPQHGADFTYVENSSKDELAVSDSQPTDTADQVPSDGLLTSIGIKDLSDLAQHSDSREGMADMSHKPRHVDSAGTDQEVNSKTKPDRQQNWNNERLYNKSLARERQAGAGRSDIMYRDPSPSTSLEKAHLDRSPFGSALMLREHGLPDDEENYVMADNLPFESPIKTRPLVERQRDGRSASAQPSRDRAGQQLPRYLQGSSVFAAARSDMDGVKRDGPSHLLRRTLEMLADTPNRQSDLGRIIDNLTKSKADKASVELQQEINEERILDLQEKSHRQENELVAFREIVQHVSSQKVDRDYLNFALSMKSDKKDIAELIDMKYFKRNIKVLEDSLDNLRLKVKNLERESNWRATIDKLLAKVNEKAEKDEVISVKKILQNFEAKLNELVQKDFQTPTEEAVAFRKRMIPFNCLSCSKNVSLDPNKAPLSLPVEGGVAGYKTHRPYTSYELKSIRDQLQERDDVYDVYSAPRPVGGTYTMVDPLKHLRHPKNATLEESMSRDKTVSPPTGNGPHSTINIHNHIVVGQDGKIYKGTQSNKLPDISKKINPSPSPSSMERTPTVTISGIQNKDNETGN